MPRSLWTIAVSAVILCRFAFAADLIIPPQDLHTNDLPASTNTPATITEGAVRAIINSNKSGDTNQPEAPEWKPLPLSRFQEFLTTIGYPSVQYYGMVFFEGGGGYSYYYRPVPADYVVGPGDEMALRMWGKIDLKEVLVVDPEGRVDLPHVGPVVIAGKHISEVRTIFTDAMNRVFTDVKLDVTITRLRTIEVMVTGEARQPGVYRFGAGAGVLQVLTMAGGILPSGSMRGIRLLRNGAEAAVIDIYDLLMKGAYKETGELLDGDTVFVPRVQIQVAVLGGVRHPAIYELDKEHSLGDVILLAGGLDFTGVRNTAIVYRMNDNGRLQTNEFPLGDKTYTPAHGDVVVVMEPPNAPPRMITVEGEVVRPGNYPYSDGMRISDLIDSAGGLTANAYLRGSNFRRESVRAIQQERLDESIRDLEIRMAANAPDVGSPDVANTLQYQKQLVEKLHGVKASGRVSIDLNAALTSRNSDANILLQPEDNLAVPPIPSTVTVVGALYSQTGVVYRDGMTVKEALDSVGGVSESADKASIYVLRADGKAVSQTLLKEGGYAWDSSRHRWQPRTMYDVPLLHGDTVVVPVKLERRIYPLTLAKDISQILYNIAVSTGVVVSVF
jgi:protein involved in polysaccharide export with SLBB domain